MANDLVYNSAYTGAQIDAAISAVRQKESDWDAKDAVALWFTLPSSSWADNSQAAENAGLISAGYTYCMMPNDSGITADDVTVDGQIMFRCISAPADDVEVCVVRIEGGA